jgi:hypothetical protein
MTRCGEQNELFIVNSLFGDRSPAGISRNLHLAAVRLFGFTRRLRAVAYAQNKSFASSVVLVLDLLWGPTVAARVTPAARFGRSLSLPPMSDALCLEQSFSSSSSSFSFSICSGGQP